MKQKISKKLVDAIEPGESDIIVWDTVLPGFHLKVTPSGRKVFMLYYRTQDGKQRRPKVGVYGPVTCDQARSIAQAMLGRVAMGDDPSGERAASRRRITLGEFWPIYLESVKSRVKPRTFADKARLWKSHIEPVYSKRYLESITSQDVREFHQSMVDTPVEANRTLAELKGILNKAIELEYMKGQNPASKVKLYPEKSRELFLSSAQLGAVLSAIAEEESLFAIVKNREGESFGQGGKGMKETESRGIMPQAAALFRLLIFTGARVSEIREAKWSYLDINSGSLRLPDSKTGRKSVWLNSLAIEELERLLKNRTQNTWIIEGKKPGCPMVNPQKPWRRVRERAARKFPEGSSDRDVLMQLRLHDLRHSFASFAVASGVPLFLVGKSLGHAQSRTTERYAHIADNPLKEAVESVAMVIKRAQIEPQALEEE